MALGQGSARHRDPPGSDPMPTAAPSCHGPISTSHGSPALAALMLLVVRVDGHLLSPGPWQTTAPSVRTCLSCPLPLASRYACLRLELSCPPRMWTRFAACTLSYAHLCPVPAPACRGPLLGSQPRGDRARRHSGHRWLSSALCLTWCVGPEHTWAQWTKGRTVAAG